METKEALAYAIEVLKKVAPCLDRDGDGNSDYLFNRDGRGEWHDIYEDIAILEASLKG